jgi:hypothetical protein
MMKENEKICIFGVQLATTSRVIFSFIRHRAIIMASCHSRFIAIKFWNQLSRGGSMRRQIFSSKKTMILAMEVAATTTLFQNGSRRITPHTSSIVATVLTLLPSKTGSVQLKIG